MNYAKTGCFETSQSGTGPTPTASAGGRAARSRLGQAGACAEPPWFFGRVWSNGHAGNVRDRDRHVSKAILFFAIIPRLFLPLKQFGTSWLMMWL